MSYHNIEFKCSPIRCVLYEEFSSNMPVSHSINHDLSNDENDSVTEKKLLNTTFTGLLIADW